MKLTLASKITIIRVALIPLIVLLMYLPGQVAAIAATIKSIMAAIAATCPGRYMSRTISGIRATLIIVILLANVSFILFLLSFRRSGPKLSLL